MKNYDFDAVIDRYHTNSKKWNIEEGTNLLPMWLADMDFVSLPEISEAIKKLADFGVFGYTDIPDSYFESVINWMDERHGFEIRREWIAYTPGVVPAINMAVKAFSDIGDKIIIQTPVYYPFFKVIENNKRIIIENALINNDGHYVIDFIDLEKKAQDPKTKILILCSPHNPVGRVWTKQELTRLGEICMENNVIVISDEIHCDFVFEGSKHHVFSSLNEKFKDNSITCLAPSKTFNLAGLQTSSIIIQNEKLREKYNKILEDNCIKRPNIFAIVASEAAYNNGQEWVDQLVHYIEANLNYLCDYIETNIPEIEVVKPEGTYLVWLDFRKLNMDSEELEDFMLNKANLWLDKGCIFGENGKGFQRINLACPRSILVDALSRLEAAVEMLKT